MSGAQRAAHERRGKKLSRGSNKLLPACNVQRCCSLEIRDIDKRRSGGGGGASGRVSRRKRDISTDKNGNEQDTIDECRLCVRPIDTRKVPPPPTFSLRHPEPKSHFMNINDRRFCEDPR